MNESDRTLLSSGSTSELFQKDQITSTTHTHKPTRTESSSLRSVSRESEKNPLFQKTLIHSSLTYFTVLMDGSLIGSGTFSIKNKLAF
jgi:hypothetical protein